jgi:hypothetical protein
MEFTREQIAEYLIENERLKKEQAEKTDPEDSEKRRRQEEVLAELKQVVKEWSKEKVFS